MKVLDLIVPDVPAVLSHPVLGLVDWRHDDIGGWGLYWHVGPEQGQPLVADEAVLLCDRWRLIGGDDGR